MEAIERHQPASDTVELWSVAVVAPQCEVTLLFDDAGQLCAAAIHDDSDL